MRIASLVSDTPDGQLVIVSDDLTACQRAEAPTLQAALDGEGFGVAGSEAERFDAKDAMAALPRSFQFLDGSAYVNHVDLVRKSRGAEMPARFWTDPLMYQGCSLFLNPSEDIVGDPEWGLDFEAEVAVITSKVPRGIDPINALECIEFVTLINDISLRNLIPDELSKGFGFVQSKPRSSMAPIAVSPDELPNWRQGKLHGTLCVDLNGKAFGRADAGVDMTFDFGTLISHAAKTRGLEAGTVIGSGTISNRSSDGGPGAPISDGGLGYSCIAEQRMVEALNRGEAQTPYLKAGDTVKVWMEDASGQLIFGAIDQRVSGLDHY